MVDVVALSEHINYDDLNGDHFLGTQEGEMLGPEEIRTYLFPHEMPSATNPHDEVALTKGQSTGFILHNAYHIASLDKTISVGDSIKIAYARLLAVKHGLVSPNFLPADHHVNYTEAVQLTDEKTKESLDKLGGYTKEIIAAALTAPVMYSLNKLFTDRVCAVAFVFRARGHHYTDDYRELYERIWDKCRHKPGELMMSWKDIATVAYHAIFPDILDSFWTQSVSQQRCNGALAKRHDVAPAGAAGPYVLKQGVEDLLMIAPGVENRLKGQLEYLDLILAELSKHRFNGSVNAKYYGAQRIPIDEKKLGAIAATIRAALDNLTDNAPLAQSPALKRISTNAPITGAVLGKAIGNIANMPEVVNPLVAIDKVS